MLRLRRIPPYHVVYDICLLAYVLRKLYVKVKREALCGFNVKAFLVLQKRVSVSNEIGGGGGLRWV